MSVLHALDTINLLPPSCTPFKAHAPNEKFSDLPGRKHVPNK